jgi:hypothetical protein
VCGHLGPRERGDLPEGGASCSPRARSTAYGLDLLTRFLPLPTLKSRDTALRAALST